MQLKYPEYKQQFDITRPDFAAQRAKAAETLSKPKWQDYALPAIQGAAGLGAGLAEAFAEEGNDATSGSIPSGSSPQGVDSQAVGQPFSGRMKLSPEQRQSLALALLGKMV